jgi:uridine phosphorylase
MKTGAWLRTLQVMLVITLVLASLLAPSCVNESRLRVADTEALIKQLAVGDDQERAAAATALGDAEVARAVPALVATALDDPSTDVQSAAAGALESFGAAAVHKTLATVRERLGKAPILEYDTAREAMIEPQMGAPALELPERCVICFFPEVFEKLEKEGKAKVVYRNGGESGESKIYVIELRGQKLAAVHPGVGAPLAVARLELMIALGCRKFIACGGAGVLDSSIDVGTLLVPTSAVRDEGTSYHYLPAAREVAAGKAALAAIKAALDEAGIPYRETKTWTTDAVYRETRSKIARRRSEGCLAVEMEAAAFFAVAQFQGVEFGQILYGGDDLGGKEWDSRDWKWGQTSTREKLFWLAAEACLRL